MAFTFAPQFFFLIFDGLGGVPFLFATLPSKSGMSEREQAFLLAGRNVISLVRTYFHDGCCHLSMILLSN
jgi:hypothetical protein